MSLQGKSLALAIAKILDDKKAQEIEVYDVSGVCSFAEYFVIASGNSVTQTKALADEVEAKLQEQNIHFRHKEGYRSANWILLNYYDVVVHIFHPESRNFYHLERLWADAPKIDISDILS